MFGRNKNQVDLKVFVMFDTKTESYGDPMHAVNEHDLIRQLVAGMEKDPKNHRLYMNAEDFTLFEIGKYNRKEGLLDPYSTPKSIVPIIELRSMVDRNVKEEFTENQINLIREAVKEEIGVLLKDRIPQRH